MPKPKYHIIVCTNSRPPGHPKPSCGAAGAANLLMAFNMGLMERGYQPGQVLITGSACLGPCEYGPTVVVYPDATWYAQVKEGDVAAILDEHIGKGTPVERLKPNSVWGS
ncbi:MAG TPA: (2Fe-2S) ferredoxin domain-containing protein [Nitrospiraceae bacterium]|jgi:(2Fe-2S) ferredoxin|nr:(2Fe-2S) ferredoxin domain-containing protein [Nitrospiraceae bacterium]